MTPAYLKTTLDPFLARVEKRRNQGNLIAG